MYFSFLVKRGSVHGRFLYSNTIYCLQDKILLSFKAASLGEWVRKCKETPCCEDAASVKNKDKKSLDCYMLASNKSDGDDETFLEMRIKCSVDVSPFRFCFTWNGFEIKRITCVFRRQNNGTIFQMCSWNDF